MRGGWQAQTAGQGSGGPRLRGSVIGEHVPHRRPQPDRAHDLHSSGSEAAGEEGSRRQLACQPKAGGFLSAWGARPARQQLSRPRR